MRILMTADTVGGVWTYALELTRALQPYNVEVLLAIMGPSLNTSQQNDARSLSNLSLFKSNYKLEWMPECWPDVKRAGDWLLHLANRPPQENKVAVPLLDCHTRARNPPKPGPPPPPPQAPPPRPPPPPPPPQPHRGHP